MSTPHSMESPQKRRKVQKACTQCRHRKRRCSGELPCTLCLGQNLPCSYTTPVPPDTATSSPSAASLYGHNSQDCSAEGGQSSTRLIVPVAEQEVEAAQDVSRSSRAVSVSGEGVTEGGAYIGPTSTFSFLRKAGRRFSHPTPPAHDSETTSQTSIFKFGDRKVPSEDLTQVSLPDNETLQLLLGRYFNFTAPTYRSLHEPTVRQWVSDLQTDYGHENVHPAREAIVLLIVATASLFTVDADGNPSSDPLLAEDKVTVAERWFQAAQRKLSEEVGRVQLESIQARLAGTMFLLNTSRLNEAWFLFGTAWQLAVTLGIHRRSSSIGRMQGNNILHECRKRTFWAAYTLDTYLSVMLGRPTLIPEHGADQDFPELVNDEDLTAQEIRKPTRPKDCVAAAPVFHAQLARIVREASIQQHHISRATVEQLQESCKHLNVDIDNWQRSLPPFLSGGIHPFSLIALFRRQQTVLQMASAHATMIVNRPLIVYRLVDSNTSHTMIERCVSAAKLVLDMVVEMVANNGLFPAYYNTQYVTFLALSVAYVWIIQRRTGKIQMAASIHDDRELFDLAECVQQDLAAATKLNAPNLRYSAILEELQQETRNCLQLHNLPRNNESVDINSNDAQIVGEIPLDWDKALDLSLDAEFWQQLDMFPFSSSL